MRRPPTAAQPSPAAGAADAVLIDTGLLVAIFNRSDAHHASALAWIAGHTARLLTVAPVLTEAAYFLPGHLRPALARLVGRGVFEVHQPDAAGYLRVAELFEKYADQDPDWADLELVWLAESTGIRRIATLDVADFSVYRIHGRKRFELELLR